MRIARISGATSRTREPTVDGGVLLGYQELAQVVRTWRHGCDPGAAEAVPGSGTQHRLALKPKDHREPPLVMRRSQRHTSYLEWVMEQDSRPALLQRPRMHSAKKNHLCLTFTMMRQMWTCGFCSSGLCAKLRGLWHGSAPKCWRTSCSSRRIAHLSVPPCCRSTRMHAGTLHRPAPHRLLPCAQAASPVHRWSSRARAW